MSVFGKGSKLFSIFRSRCPRCQEGEVFEERNPYKLGKLFKMHDNCSHCGLNYELEPNFFYGAMYVSYAFSVALFVATYILMNIFMDPEIEDIIIALALVVVILAPAVLRLSRMTWLNFFVKYEPEKRGTKRL